MADTATPRNGKFSTIARRKREAGRAGRGLCLQCCTARADGGLRLRQHRFSMSRCLGFPVPATNKLPVRHRRGNPRSCCGVHGGVPTFQAVPYAEDVFGSPWAGRHGGIPCAVSPFPVVHLQHLLFRIHLTTCSGTPHSRVFTRALSRMHAHPPRTERIYVHQCAAAHAAHSRLHPPEPRAHARARSVHPRLCIAVASVVP